jgi:hypothetical protein
MEPVVVDRGLHAAFIRAWLPRLDVTEGARARQGGFAFGADLGLLFGSQVCPARRSAGAVSAADPHS